MQLPIKNCVYQKSPLGSVTQWFGENAALYRPWGLKAHNGIDIVAPHGEPMMAVEDCVVLDVKLDPKGFGKHVRLLSKANKSGVYREWTYGHCSQIHVVVGSEVKAGEVIALMGNTGFVVSGYTPWWKTITERGTHLHIGVREVIKTDRGWRYNNNSPRIEVLNYENGYKGCIDPLPILTSGSDDNDPRIPLYIQYIELLKQYISLLKAK